MTFIDENTSRIDLQCIILNEKELYSKFDETKFLNDEYTTEEMREAIIEWIEAGDECKGAF